MKLDDSELRAFIKEELERQLKPFLAFLNELESDKKEKLFTSGEVAEKLAVHKQTIYRLIKEGKLKVIKIENITRISESAIQDYLALPRLRERRKFKRGKLIQG